MIQKRYIKTRKTVKITFKVDFARNARQVEVLGDFNDWTPVTMKRATKGLHQYTIELEPGQSYQYRYRIDGDWANDWAADAYIPNGFGDDNSVVIC